MNSERDISLPTLEREEIAICCADNLIARRSSLIISDFKTLSCLSAFICVPYPEEVAGKLKLRKSPFICIPLPSTIKKSAFPLTVYIPLLLITPVIVTESGETRYMESKAISPFIPIVINFAFSKISTPVEAATLKVSDFVVENVSIKV